MFKKIIVNLLVVALLCLVVVGCGSNEYSEESYSKDSVSEKSSDMKMESEEVEETKEVPVEDMAMEAEGPIEPDRVEEKSDNDLEGAVDNRKYIRTFSYFLETLEFDKAEIALKRMVDLNFGFFQSTQSEGNSINSSSRQRSANYTVRIPKEKVEDFIESLEGIGNVVDSNSMVEDVTSQYYDIEARITTLEIQEKRLIAILEEADNLEYIIQLERELSNVRYEIESYMSNFRYLKDQINYSTVYIYLQEVKEETIFEEEPETFVEKMSEGFLDSIESVVEFFSDLALFIIVSSPILLIWAIFIFVIYKIIKKLLKSKAIKKKERQKTKLNQSNNNKQNVNKQSKKVDNTKNSIKNNTIDKKDIES